MTEQQQNCLAAALIIPFLIWAEIILLSTAGCFLGFGSIIGAHFSKVYFPNLNIFWTAAIGVVALTLLNVAVMVSSPTTESVSTWLMVIKGWSGVLVCYLCLRLWRGY